MNIYFKFIDYDEYRLRNGGKHESEVFGPFDCVQINDWVQINSNDKPFAYLDDNREWAVGDDTYTDIYIFGESND